MIDILIDNALRHGRGSVTLLVEDTSVDRDRPGPGLSDEPVEIGVRRTRRPVGATRPRPGARPAAGAGRRRQRRHRRGAAAAGPVPARAGLIAPNLSSGHAERGESGPENQSPPPGGGNPGDGERKETPAVCTAPVFALICGRRQVCAKSEGDTVSLVAGRHRRRSMPPSWTWPSRISTAARSPISRWITRFSGRAPNAGS